MLATVQNKKISKARLAMMALLVMAATMASLLLAPAPPASAVSGCTGYTGSGYSACVDAATGTKNYANGTQWVGNVTAYRSSGGTSSLVEIWGNGFYYSQGGNYTSRTWAVNKWVSSGTNICAAFTYPSGRQIACISITV